MVSEAKGEVFNRKKAGDVERERGEKSRGKLSVNAKPSFHRLTDALFDSGPISRGIKHSFQSHFSI